MLGRDQCGNIDQEFRIGLNYFVLSRAVLSLGRLRFAFATSVEHPANDLLNAL